MPQATDYLTQSELARVLRVSRQRVGQLLADGKLPQPVVRVGRYIGFRPQQVARIVAARRLTLRGGMEGAD